MREFFKDKVSQLKEPRNNCGRGKLFAAILTEILETLIHQLGEMEFFFPIIRKDYDRESQGTDSKIPHAPMTNLGCELELAKLDRIKICGGTTSIQTICRKNVVTTNVYLLNSDFLDLPIREKKKRWKWARTSGEIGQVRQLEADFLAKVKQAR